MTRPTRTPTSAIRSNTVREHLMGVFHECGWEGRVYEQDGHVWCFEHLYLKRTKEEGTKKPGF